MANFKTELDRAAEAYADTTENEILMCTDLVAAAFTTGAKWALKSEVVRGMAWKLELAESIIRHHENMLLEKGVGVQSCVGEIRQALTAYKDSLSG